MAKRKQVSLQEFLNVTVKRRNEFKTIAEAAKAVGLTENSFKQRMSRERKRYPNIYASVPHYRVGGGTRIAEEGEALQILAELGQANQGDA